MLLETIRRIGYKALIICEKKEILQQFIGYLKDTFNMQPGEYGTIQEGKVEIGSLVTVALRQTLARIDLTPYKFEWGTICIDECQNVGGSVTKCTQYSKILNNIASEYRYGVSATGYRTDGLTRFMYSILNTIKYEIPEDAIADKIIKAKVKPIRTTFKIPLEALDYSGVIKYTTLPSILATDDSRNKLIANLLKKEKDNYNLILSDRLEGLEILHNEIGGLFINGSMTSKKAKQERQDAIEKMRNKEEHYLFASYSLAKEGLDIKPLNRVFLIAPTKNKVVLIQSVGRIERKDEGKDTPIVYDLIDNDKYFEDAWKKRRGIYKKNRKYYNGGIIMLVSEKYVKHSKGASKECTYKCDMCKKNLNKEQRIVVGMSKIGDYCMTKKWDLCEHCVKIIEKNVNLWYSRIEKIKN